mmetsp:Transcript_74453/g.215864  ORF Transcript_74453/g.215864 Transcript_74453/m.215864 type:complete len:762 (-) Transcript_74453:124-2409(-)|eukprot:CAMPEP_0176091540 /NCGR_PEP_ID=MMETSP0120_2-20121206/45853_1 /TAXON_ID=160619 /ORGANISM="Kryptoperidinium foliaceum, Strain CCMP 1326" /LENGTH=761 /DNA_ID=CAMNT_0017425439 /DNA_START=67 /DNA_END=2352 /DNA_ORIENTATION=-
MNPGEEDDGDKLIQGPVRQRHCTDAPCAIVFIAYIAGFCYLCYGLQKHSDPHEVTAGRDYRGRSCGWDAGVEDLKSVYFPDLAVDFKGKNVFAPKYGICVATCPKARTVLEDYVDDPMQKRRKAQWFVASPSVSVIGRCLPYDDPVLHQDGRMCAWPRCLPAASLACTKGDILCKARKICGSQDDFEDTSEFWYLTPPRALQQPVRGRTRPAAMEIDGAFLQEHHAELEQACEVPVSRSFQLSMEVDDNAFSMLMKRYSGTLFRSGKVLLDNFGMVLAIGFGSSLVLSFLLILGFSAHMGFFIWVAIALLFVGLIALDYCFFVKAGIASGRTGTRLLDRLQGGGDLLYTEPPAPMLRHMPDIKRSAIESLRAEEDPVRQTVFRVLAFLLAAGIFLMTCVIAYLRKRIKVVVALAREAARVLREMPSLMIFPLVGVGSVALLGGGLAFTMVCIMTLRPTALLRFSEKYPFIDVSEFQEDPERAQRYLIYLVGFSVLWLWFFHVALFLTTVSGAVADWYFYRLDPVAERRIGIGMRSPGWYFGRPVLMSCGRVIRYHVGSVAVGSLILALVKLPRLALEYAEQQLDSARGNNGAAQVALNTSRCCLCCLDRCITFLTNYAFIYVAITGKSFCPAAQSAMGLVVKYPVQLAVESFASSVVYWLVVLAVPTINVVIAYILIPTAWGVCGLVIAVTSFMVAAIAISVYDVCMTSLFVCAVRDAEYFDGRYAPLSLREAMGMTTVDAKGPSLELQRWPPAGELGDNG